MTPSSCHALTLALLLALSGCSDSDTTPSGDGGATKLGTLRVDLTYQGKATLSAQSKVVLVLMECPFKMPPVAFGGFATPESPAQGELPNIPPGTYCVDGFIDLLGSGGNHPKPGAPVIKHSSGKSTTEVTITAGQTTNVALTFEDSSVTSDGGTFPADGGVGSDGGAGVDSGTVSPGPNDVWVQVKASCPTCATTGSFKVYGYNGGASGGMPNYLGKVPSISAWPITALFKESKMMVSAPWPEGEVTFKGHHDVNNAGMGVEPGEPVSGDVTVTLKKGTLNTVTLTLQ